MAQSPDRWGGGTEVDGGTDVEAVVRAGDAGSASPWQELMRLLAPEPARANEAYSALRRRLIDVFRWRSLSGPEDLADEVFDRVVAQLAAGEQIRSVHAFVLGVAHHLAMEASRRATRLVQLDETRHEQVPADAPADLEATGVVHLERCLGELPADVRDQLLRYYVGSGQTRIAQRKSLAETLGIGLNALRIRMHRLRGRLQECLHRCGEDDHRAGARA